MEQNAFVRIFAASNSTNRSHCHLANNYGGGEDYELLFTIDQKDYEKIQTMSADVTVIGYMTDDKGVAEMITPDNHVIPIKAQGWDHMKKHE